MELEISWGQGCWVGVQGFGVGLYPGTGPWRELSSLLVEEDRQSLLVAITKAVGPLAPRHDRYSITFSILELGERRPMRVYRERWGRRVWSTLLDRS